MDIAARIKSIRERNNINQREFGERLGKSVRAVQSWEQGAVEPPIKVINQIAKTFNVSSAWLFTGLDDSILKNNEENAVSINFYQNINEEHLFEHPIKFNFYKHALKKMLIDNDCVDVITVEGDSMSPKFNARDLVFVDRTKKNLKDGKFFVVQIGNSVRVRQVQEQGSKVLLVSSNQQYRDIAVDSSCIEKMNTGIDIIGMVVGAIAFCE